MLIEYVRELLACTTRMVCINILYYPKAKDVGAHFFSEVRPVKADPLVFC